MGGLEVKNKDGDWATQDVSRPILTYDKVEAAQKDIVTIAKRLIADGELIMGDADDDYV